MGVFYITDSDFIEHHGVKGMKWGVRRLTKKKERLVAAKKKYADNIKKYKAELEKPITEKQQMKADKYKAKISKYESKYSVRRARRRAIAGKRVGIIGRHNTKKLYKYQAKYAKLIKKPDLYRARISKFEYKSYRAQKRIERVTEKLKKYKVSDI